MFKRAEKLATYIKKSDQTHIVSHIDADGITAGAIAYQTLKRLDKNFTIEFVKQLDNSIIERLLNKNYDLVWFTDLGSSISVDYQQLNKIITDHHECPKNSNLSFHLNPHLVGLDGTIQISGAGTTYLVSKAINKSNIDLSCLAIIGACGDLQDRKFCKLIGLNREILKDGIEANVLYPKIDISYFGRETRPIHKLLQYSNDPFIPGLSGRDSACLSFLQDLNIKLKDGDNWRNWNDLCKEERRKIISKISQILLRKGFGHKITRRLISEIYILSKEEAGIETRDAKEFATLLNSTARYNQCEVGLNVCLGDRSEWLKKAQKLLQGHRCNLVEGLQFVKDVGIEKRKYLQFFHAGTGVRDTIIGIITNMLINSEEISSELPLIGFADKGKGEIKVSARGTEELVQKGLNLSKALKKSAKIIEGIGGGHNIAAGATIPKGKEEEFLDLLEKEIEIQLSF